MAENTVKVHIYSWRKAGMTPDEFKAHYEESHMPLIKKLAGPLLPITHTRHYMNWFPSDPRDIEGSQQDAAADPHRSQFDCWAELVFPSMEAVATLTARTQEPDVKAMLEEDEAKFLDKKKMVFGIVADTHVTSRG